MPDAYGLQEGRFIQQRSNTSAANAHTVLLTAVPAGKIWTILAASGVTSADDTQDYWWAINAAGIAFSITRPEQHIFDVSESNWLPLVREGMEIKLFPGEQLSFNRDGAVAGSTISIYARIIETDLPLYTYDEPQVVKRQTQTLSTVKQILGGGGGASSGGGGIVGRPRGGPMKR